MFIYALKKSLPVAFGYIPMGMAFGLLLQNLGVEWWWATLMGLFIFAGSAQFLAIGLLGAGVPWFEVFTSTLFLNLRHVFYGLSLYKRYKGLGWLKPYAIFGLTDETFSLILTEDFKGNESKGFISWITLINQFWWVLGCTLGALLGKELPLDTKGLEFSLTALFIVLLIDQTQKSRQVIPILMGVIAGSLSLWILKGQYFLLMSIGLVLISSIIIRPQNGE